MGGSGLTEGQAAITFWGFLMNDQPTSIRAVDLSRSSPENVRSAQVRLLVRRRQGRRQGRDEDPARRQGGQPRRDERHRHPRPAGVHDHHRGLRRLLRERQEAPARGRPPDPGRHQADGKPLRGQVRRPGEPLARLGPIGRGALDARHDEHDPQPGPDRRLGRGPGQEDRQRPVRLRRIPPPDRHVRLDRHGRRARAVRARDPRPQGAEGREARHRAVGRRPEGAGQAVQGRLQAPRRRGFPAGPGPAAHAGDQRRVQLLERQEGHRVPPDRADLGPRGDGGQRPGDGVRQHGRDLGHRGRLHPRPEHRRERLLRRLPHQRPGRGRGRRHSHARADRPARPGHAQGLQGADGDPREARTAL